MPVEVAENAVINTSPIQKDVEIFYNMMVGKFLEVCPVKVPANAVIDTPPMPKDDEFY